MNLEYFPHFIRANYPVIANESNEDLMEIGIEFKKYLEEKFKDNMDKLKPIWNIDAKTVIMSRIEREPFTMNGYHPALIIHFGNFVEKMNKEAQNKK
jgi:hypothetical protein